MIDLSFRHDLWAARLQRSPAGVGRVALCVVRDGPGARSTPERVELAVGRGVVGDRWSAEDAPQADAEVSLTNVHVLRAIAGDDEARIALAGDNLVVDLDLAEASLPVGALLRVGEALLRVTPLPHRGCAKFVERYGALAAKRVSRMDRRGLRGRGVLCAVVEGGVVRRGDPIRSCPPSVLVPDGGAGPVRSSVALPVR